VRRASAGKFGLQAGDDRWRHERGNVPAPWRRFAYQCGSDRADATEAGMNTVCTSGAMVSFMPFNCIS